MYKGLALALWKMILIIINFYHLKGSFACLFVLCLTGFVRVSSTNFPVQAVALVTVAKQANTFPRACTSICHWTDHLTFISTYRLQSLL